MRSSILGALNPFIGQILKPFGYIGDKVIIQRYFILFELSELPNLLHWVRSEVSKADIEIKTIHKIELAIEEAVVNILYYGYPEKKGKIRVDLNISKDKCIVSLQDWGIPFDPLKNSNEVDIDAPLDQREIGGLGIFMIQQMMDEISYVRLEDANIFTLVKRR